MEALFASYLPSPLFKIKKKKEWSQISCWLDHRGVIVDQGSYENLDNLVKIDEFFYIFYTFQFWKELHHK